MPSASAVHSARRGSLQRAIAFLVVAASLLVAVYRSTLLSIALGGVLVAANLILLRRDGHSGAALGLELAPRRAAEFGIGAAGGAVLALIVLGLLRLVTPFHWEPNADFSAAMAAFSLAFLLVANACEELVFRGYPFDVLVRAIGAWPAQLLVAVAFALFHVASGWPWVVAVTATTAGSLLFGAIVLRWRSLPAAIGLHVMWNWTRDLLFQTPATRSTLLLSVGVDRWGGRERTTSLALLVAVTLLACAVITFGSDPARRPGQR